MKGVCEVENRMIEEWQERERERESIIRVRNFRSGIEFGPNLRA